MSFLSRVRVRLNSAGSLFTRRQVNLIAGTNMTISATDDAAGDEIDITFDAAGGTGAPTDADYLVGTANGGLSNEIVVGTTPGGELGNTWASPTVDATHSGSSHAATQAAAEATAASALSGHTGDTVDAHDASAVSFTPAGSIAATDVQAAIEEVAAEAGGGGGAPADATYLVTAANAGLSAEVVVGATPGGELGGTWDTPTVDATHAGSTHSAATDTHIADTVDAHDASAISFTPAGSIAATDVQAAIEEVASEAGGGGAPTTADYLVGTAQAGLSAEIVVGTTPGGELGGTWAAPTVDSVHSGSAHHAEAHTHDFYIEQTWTIDGAVAVATGDKRWYPPYTSWVLDSVRASVSTAPTGASLICDIHKNGTTVFTTQSKRPTIAASTNTDLSDTPDVTAGSGGDYYTMDVDQVGSTVPGSNLTVTVRIRVTAA